MYVLQFTSLVGEKIKYKVLKVTSKYAYGKVLEVITPAEMRVRPECPVFGKCGGCQLQHVKYINQLKIEKSKFLLSCETYTHNEIASMCGFNDVKYFYTVFKQITNTTAKKYQKGR